MIKRANLVLLLFFSLLPSIADATDQLRFGASIPLRAQGAIEIFVKDTIQAPFTTLSIAPTDLNDDGINEYVVRDAVCPAPAETCRHFVLGDTDHGMILLADVSARNLALGSGHTRGVRDLMAQDNAGNDYKFSRYVWDASSSRYTMITQGGPGIHAN